MIQTVLNIIRLACQRGNRTVILVPEAAYEEALRALACNFDQHAGRTARMPNGNLLTILTATTPVDDTEEGFDMYLSGWGRATPKDERGMTGWMSRARTVYTEIS